MDTSKQLNTTAPKPGCPPYGAETADLMNECTPFFDITLADICAVSEGHGLVLLMLIQLWRQLDVTAPESDEHARLLRLSERLRAALVDADRQREVEQYATEVFDNVRYLDWLDTYYPVTERVGDDA